MRPVGVTKDTGVTVSWCWNHQINRVAPKLISLEGMTPLGKISIKLVFYLQVADNAEWFWTLQSTGRGGQQLVSSANQKIACRWVTAAFSANVAKLWEAEVIWGPTRWASALLSAGECLQSWENEPGLHSDWLFQANERLKTRSRYYSIGWRWMHLQLATTVTSTDLLTCSAAPPAQSLTLVNRNLTPEITGGVSDSIIKFCSTRLISGQTGRISLNCWVEYLKDQAETRAELN